MALHKSASRLKLIAADHFTRSFYRDKQVCCPGYKVHVRDDLVYDKHNGKLVGFVNLGDMNNCLLDCESSLTGCVTDRQLAKSMLVLIVRGLFAHLNFPYAQFACHTLTGKLLVDPVWEAISRLERQGIRVMALTCDVASANHRLWKMHSQELCLICWWSTVLFLHLRSTAFVEDCQDWW